MNKDDYQPVSCAQHSAYEVAIIQRQKLRLSWQDETGRNFNEIVLPVDLKTRDDREYLVVQSRDETIPVRLDHIHACEEIKN